MQGSLGEKTRRRRGTTAERCRRNKRDYKAEDIWQV